MILTIASQPYRVEYVENARDIGFELAKSNAPFITFDTETTGLHLKKDKPFLAAVCFNNQVFVYPSTSVNLSYLKDWSELVKRVYGHNVGYDCHMIANMTDDHFPVEIPFGDTMCLARLALEAKSVRHGGDKLSLKYLAKKYIDRNADKYEHEVKSWLSAKRRQDKKVLTAILKPFGWSTSRLEKALENGEKLPDEVWYWHRDWTISYPEPTYQDVPMDIMLPYVATDVILTKHLVYKFLPVVVAREQQEVMQREFDLMPVVYKMERHGIQVDRDYLLDCRTKLADYIDQMYSRLWDITGERFSVGQHAVIKQMYTEMLGKEPPSTDKKFLKKMADKGDEIAPLITRIRRFEKWLATYIDRILEVSEYDGRFYTQMNQFNPVSGRFSGDAQQFPKDPIYTEEGYHYEREHPDDTVPEQYILYHPRKSFIGRYYYLDYSQVELRVQGHYTLYFGGDKNLCRAYMPFQCRHIQSGEQFTHTESTERNRWNDKVNGESAWLDEDGKPWTETDVHMATTLKALVAMGHNPNEMDKDLIKWWRKKGKTFNFMRNYGGGDYKAAETLEIELEQAKAMNKGYTDAFPMVVTYQNAVIKTMRQQGYMQNERGRRYYLDDWNKHYAVANYLIQGTCADILKEKMILVDDFIVKHELKDKLWMVLCVHDELQFEVRTDEDVSWAVAEIKHIMEDVPDIQVPIVAEVEYTDTNWAEKKNWEVA